jgi:DNA replication protein DnaC
MSLPASASPNDELPLDRLESSTELDRAQCGALITALTQEFALLQGPPGTGKSFLGVRLIQALLDCRVEGLGPIIVM